MNYYYCINNKELLIGECTDGWAFSLVINDFPNLQAWKEAFRVPGAIIKDSEYSIISPDDMETIITFRKGTPDLVIDAIRGFGSSTSPGPHDLICLTVGESLGNYKCISNEGCWDLVIVE